MRFLMLNWRDPKNPLSGGAERVTQAYLKALVERGHEVYWFTYAFPGAPAEEVIDGITSSGRAVWELPFLKPSLGIGGNRALIW
jgi:hypothetical protein